MKKKQRTPAELMAEAQKKRVAEAEKRAKEQQKQAKKQYAENLQKTEEYKAVVNEYLASEQHFEEGFALLSQFCSNLCLMAQMGRKGAKMQSKMIYELKSLLKKKIIKPIGNVFVVKTQQRTIKLGAAVNATRVEAPTVETELTAEQRAEALESFKAESGSGFNPEELPEALKEKYEHACKYYHIKRHWHEKLKLATTDAERKAATVEVRAAEDYNHSCWQVINVWLEDGTLPGEAPEKDKAETPAEIAKEISQANSYISRQLKTLETKRGQKYEEQKAKLAERVVLLQKHDQVPEKHKAMLLKHGLIEDKVD